MADLREIIDSKPIAFFVVVRLAYQVLIIGLIYLQSKLIAKFISLSNFFKLFANAEIY
jgi:hypothetical protein